MKVQVDRIQKTEEKNPEKTYQSTNNKIQKKENAPSHQQHPPTHSPRLIDPPTSHQSPYHSGTPK
jgi:hypothetical protein